MEINRENLEALRKDPVAKRLAGFLGLDLNDVVNETLVELDHQEMINKRAKEIIKTLHEQEQNNIENNCTTKKPYSAPKVTVDESENRFAMTSEQLKKFVDDYTSVIEAVRKIDYLYGVKLDNVGNGFNLAGKVTEMIWDLIAIIFGEENREDIVDFIYGNSNFDSVKELYEELT